MTPPHFLAHMPGHPRADLLQIAAVRYWPKYNGKPLRREIMFWGSGGRMGLILNVDRFDPKNEREWIVFFMCFLVFLAVKKYSFYSIKFIE